MVWRTEISTVYFILATYVTDNIISVRRFRPASSIRATRKWKC